MATTEKAIYDKKDQYERIARELIDGEHVYAVYDLKGAGAGFIGLTDRRIVFYDQGFLQRKDKTLVSVPYSRINYVGSQADQKFLARDSSTLIVAVSGHTFEFEFHGTSKAEHAYRLILEHVLRGD